MGVVFKAEDKKLAKNIALKLVAPEISGEDIIRFQNEAKTIAKLRHPNIVDVYDFGFSDENESQLYIAMEFVDGESLAELIEENERISYLDLVPIVVQILDGLSSAHNNGVLHRDIKPSNIMLLPSDSEEGYSVKIVDFGLAKTSFEEQKLTKTGVPVGTPNYISPEQVQGKEIDQRSDLYSLGCLLYKGLTGRPPFAGGDALSTAALRLHKDPPSFFEIDQNLDCPPEIEEIVMKSLERKPAKRFSSAPKFKERLVSYFAEINQLKTLGIEKFEPEKFPWKIVVTILAVTVPLVVYMVSTMFFTYTDSLSELPVKNFGKEALSEDTANFKQGKGQALDIGRLTGDQLDEGTIQMLGPYNQKVVLSETSLNDIYLNMICNRCPNLTELNIKGTTREVTSTGYTEILRLKKLKVLEYEDMKADRGFLKMVSQLSGLKGLNIANNDGITSSDLTCLGKMSCLKKLTVGWDRNSGKTWKTSELVKFVNARKQIEALVLKTDFTGVADWENLSKLTYVKELDLRDCHGLNSQIVNRLAKMSNLKKLYLGATGINESDLESLKKRYSNIVIVGCQRGNGES